MAPAQLIIFTTILSDGENGRTTPKLQSRPIISAQSNLNDDDDALKCVGELFSTECEWTLHGSLCRRPGGIGPTTYADKAAIVRLDESTTSDSELGSLSAFGNSPSDPDDRGV